MGTKNKISYIDTYPFNIVKDVDLDFCNRLSVADIHHIIKEMVNRKLMSQRDSEILVWLYKDGKTQKECATILGITNDRISQIKLQFLRRFKPLAKHYIADHAKLNEYKNKILELEAQVKISKDVIESEGIDYEASAKELEWLNTPIKELPLSRGVTNALSRRRGELETLSDVLKLTESEILSIRNMGVGKLEELKVWLKENNLKLKGDI